MLFKSYIDNFKRHKHSKFQLMWRACHYLNVTILLGYARACSVAFFSSCWYMFWTGLYLTKTVNVYFVQL